MMKHDALAGARTKPGPVAKEGTHARLQEHSFPKLRWIRIAIVMDQNFEDELMPVARGLNG